MLLCVRLVYYLAKWTPFIHIYLDIFVNSTKTFHLFFISLIIVYLALTFTMFIIFCDSVEKYSSLTTAFVSTISFSVKDVNLMPILYDSSPLAYAIFNMIMILCFLFVASNVFITIIFIEFEKTRTNSL
jgi:hypothetical protein